MIIKQNEIKNKMLNWAIPETDKTPVKYEGMMEKIGIAEAVKNLDVIESIRANIPVAELDKKGLANNSLVGAFQLKTLSLKSGDSIKLGKLSGLCVIRHGYTDSEAGVFNIDNHKGSIVYISGRPLSGFPMKISWEGVGYDKELIVKSTYTGILGTTWFQFSYQILGS